VTLGNEKTDQVDSFTYLGSIISKDGGSSEHVKVEHVMKHDDEPDETLRVFFSQLKKVWKNRKISLQTKIRMLKAAVTVFKHGTEAWVLRKTDEGLLDILQTNCPRIVLGTLLTDLFQTVGCVESAAQHHFFGL